MKNLLIGVITALLLLSGNSAARADDGTGVKAGIKMWLNDWTRSAPEGTVRSDSVMLLGPAISLKFRNQVFVNASYLFSTSDYSFADQVVVGNVDRQDVDFTIGYLVIPGFGLQAGYKNIKMQNRDTGTASTVSGPLIGVRASAPANAAVSFYGGVNYLFTRFKGTTSSANPSFPGAQVGFQEDSPGWSFEFGIKFAFTRVFSGLFGYQYETNMGIDSRVEDTFSGVTFGAMVAF